MDVNQILENSPIGFGISDISADDATLLYVNSRYAEIFRTTPEALVGSNARDLYVNPEARQELLNQMQADGSIRDGEVKFRRADGTEFWALVSFFNTEYEGRPARMGWIYDISEMKSAEQETAERERELRDMLEASPVCVAISGEDGHFRYLNSRAMELTGAAEEQLRATKVTDNYADPNERKAVLKALQEGGRVQDAEVRMKRADGTEFWALLSIAPVTYRGEKTYVSWVIDITRRRKALQALAQSEDRFRRILESSPIGVGIAVLGPDSQKDEAVLRYVNPRHAELFGATEEQLIGTPARDLFVDPEQRATLLRQIDDTGAVRDVEVRMQRLDGSEFWGLVSFFPIEYEGQSARMAWIYDISDRKTAEAQIAEREMQLQTIMEHVPAGIALTDGDFNFVLTNRALGELYGLPEGFLDEGRPMEGAVRWLTEQGDADAAEVDQIVADRMALHRARESGTLERNLLNGRIMSYGYAPTADGGVVGVAIDVTDRRRAEERLRAFLESAPDAMVIVDQDGTIANVNAQTERLFGYAANELVGRSVDQLVPERVRGGHAEHRRRYLSDAAPRPMGAGLELAGQMKDGREFPIEISLSPIETPDGTLVSAAVRDITERRRAEDEVRRAKEEAERALDELRTAQVALDRFMDAIDHVDDGVVFWDADERFVLCNEPYRALSGGAAGLLKPGTSFEDYLRRSVELGEVEQAKGKEEQWVADRLAHHRQLGADKSRVSEFVRNGRWLRVTEQRAPDGGALILATDIHDLKEREEELQKRSRLIELLRQTAEAANKAVSFEAALGECLTRICESIGWPVGHAYLRSPDGAEKLVPSGIWHLSDEDRFKVFKEVTERTTFDVGKGLPGQVMANRRPEWIDDVMTHPNFPRAKAAQGLGVHSAFAVPVIEGTEVLAVLEFFSAEVLTPDDSTQQTFQTIIQIGDQLGRVRRRVEAEAELRRSKEQAEVALAELRTAQENLVQSEKMATLGQLTAGIAHEIKNPLNFINNFSETSVELIDELKETLEPVLDDVEDDDARDEVDDLIETLRGDMATIAGHGRRADSIMKTMLMHARGQADEHQPTDLNALIEEALNLAYHGERARHQGFNISIERDLDPTVGDVDLVPHEISRVLVNLIGNGFYATAKRAAAGDANGYEPTIAVSSHALPDEVEIRVRDNGTGIPPEVRDKLFQPFFTTKPTGEGTGLGLSLSYDIVVQNHRGAIDVDSEVGDHTTFTIRLPRRAAESAA